MRDTRSHNLFTQVANNVAGCTELFGDLAVAFDLAKEGGCRELEEVDQEIQPTAVLKAL